MIVDEPPFELAVVFADADAQALVSRLIERGQQRGCLRPFRWLSRRDAMRDSFVTRPRDVVELLVDRRATPRPRVMLLWDHAGSGREGDAPEVVEAEMRSALGALVQPSELCIAAFVPEVEVCLIPVWARVKQVMAQHRDRLPPDDSAVLRAAVRLQRRERRPKPLAADFDVAARESPKEIFEGLLADLNLRSGSRHFEDLANALSIPALKQDTALGRVAEALVRWFPGDAGALTPGERS